jgi:NADP-dependent 3-hydroxy acid dehydrogenase YdfG
MSRLANSSAIVTGASSGIGRATALALAAKGARLALLARSANDLKKVVEEAQALGSPESFSASVDVRDEDAVNEFIATTLDRYAQIDVLINSAGLSINGEAMATIWRTGKPSSTRT